MKRARDNATHDDPATDEDRQPFPVESLFMWIPAIAYAVVWFLSRAQ